MFSKPSEFTGGSYFAPLDHLTALGLLVEPKRIDKNVPNDYRGEARTRDEVTADVTVFATSEALEKGEPTVTLKGVLVTHTMLASTLGKIIGGALVGVIRKVPTKAGSGYAFRDVEADVEGQVGEFYKAREAAVEAALSGDGVPDFDA